MQLKIYVLILVNDWMKGHMKDIIPNVLDTVISLMLEQGNPTKILSRQPVPSYEAKLEGNNISLRKS